jgi:hypothetical protein
MNKDLRIANIDEKINALELKLNDSHLCEGTALLESRVSGYYRPVRSWNQGKQQEFKERFEYNLNK